MKPLLITLLAALLCTGVHAQTAPLRGCLGTYNNEPRRPDGRINIPKLLAELADLRANTYNFLIWHKASDWEDLKLFLPQARAQNISVWVTLVPPSESPPHDVLFSEPFRLDFDRWMQELATLSLTETNLVALSIDDFLHDQDFFTPERVRAFLDVRRRVNPRLAFVPCCYFRQITPEVAAKYRGLFDGVLFPYRAESLPTMNLTDATRLEAETEKIRDVLGGGLPVILDVYASAHASLGGSTAAYVQELVRRGLRCCDGVLIYCHQDPVADAAKYQAIRTEFHAAPPPAAPSPAPVPGVVLPFDRLPRMELAFDFGDVTPEWTLQSQSATEARYAWQGHSLTVRLEGKEASALVRFRLEPPPGRALDLRGYLARMTRPTDHLHAVVMPNTAPVAGLLLYHEEHKQWPDLRIYRCRIPEGFKETANANSEMPFILVADAQGTNRMAVGWNVAGRASRLRGEAVSDGYALTLSRQNDIPFTGDKLEDTLFVSTAADLWWDVARAYAVKFDELNRRPPRPRVPAWATDPVFCTWYCYLDQIHQDGVLKIARKCKELGFGTLLIDAGWDSRTHGGYLDFQNGILGDFTAVPDRFPDLAGAIRKIHDMGLRVELWSAPFWQAKKSRAYQEKTGPWHAWTKKEGENYALCPRHPGTRDFLREKFAGIARAYDVDGMWLDAADAVPAVCVAPHAHIAAPMGDAFTECLAAAREGLRSVKPDAVTEVRVGHGNLQSKPAFDLVQPSDAPESFEVLRVAGIHIRTWAHDIQLKSDPMYWAPGSDAATIGKFLATMVCNGVPALSVDYLTAPEDQCRQTAAWLAFYQKHKATLLRGEFRLFGAKYSVPDMMLVGRDEAVVYLRHGATREVPLPRRVRRVILLNCTDADTLTLRITPSGPKQRVQYYQPDWTPAGSQAMSRAGVSAPLTYAVGQGCPAVVEWR